MSYSLSLKEKEDITYEGRGTGEESRHVWWEEKKRVAGTRREKILKKIIKDYDSP